MRPCGPLGSSAINDIVGAALGRREELEVFLKFVSNFHPAFQFTSTIIEIELPAAFLDINLRVSDAWIQTSVHYKDTDTQIRGHPRPFHPPFWEFFLLHILPPMPPLYIGETGRSFRSRFGEHLQHTTTLLGFLWPSISTPPVTVFLMFRCGLWFHAIESSVKQKSFYSWGLFSRKV